MCQGSQRNLFSVAAAMQQGLEIENNKTGEQVELLDSDRNVLCGICKEDNQYKLLECAMEADDMCVYEACVVHEGKVIYPKAMATTLVESDPVDL
jgi:hypothetical protein